MNTLDNIGPVQKHALRRVLVFRPAEVFNGAALLEKGSHRPVEHKDSFLQGIRQGLTTKFPTIHESSSFLFILTHLAGLRRVSRSLPAHTHIHRVMIGLETQPSFSPKRQTATKQLRFL